MVYAAGCRLTGVHLKISSSQDERQHTSQEARTSGSVLLVVRGKAKQILWQEHRIQSVYAHYNDSICSVS